MFIRGDCEADKSEGEKQRMLDMITALIAGLGGVSLTAAFLDYRLSRMKRGEAKARPL
jgi:hypothetical protein